MKDDAHRQPDQRQGDEDGDEGHAGDGNVGGEDVCHRFLEVVQDPPSQPTCGDDGCEVVVQQHDGTAAVLFGSLALSAFTPARLFVLAVGLLAAVRPVLWGRNYTLYSVAMTPLIVILLEFGAASPSGALLYRLADTGIGFLIAVVLGVLLRPSLRAGPV